MRVRRVDTGGPGWSLRRRGRGFELRDARGRLLTGDASRERVAALAIPPAWRDVWICPSPQGHVQATGVDAAGRRQYLYHEEWTRRRSRAKFDRMSEFALALPALRAAIERDLDVQALHRATVLAGLARLLDLGFFRVGSERYASQNRTFGLTTLRREHATVKRDGSIVFDYTAKHGKRRVQRVGDEAAGELVSRLKRRRLDPRPRLFASCEDHRWTLVQADDLNDYLRTATSADVTAKDFRTWNATVLAAAQFAVLEVPSTRRGRELAAGEVLRSVAEQLGNTPAVCKASYVDPRVTERWAHGRTLDLTGGELPPRIDDWTDADRTELERRVVELLDLDEAPT